MEIEKCCKCENMAVWAYMPNWGTFYCDDCVSSINGVGCSCNWRYTDVNVYHPSLDNPDLPEGIENIDWKWVNKDEGCWQSIDKKGRPWPCCEFDFDSEGFNIEIN